MAPWHSLYLKRKLCGASKIKNFLLLKRENRNRNSDATFGTVFRNRKYFQRGKEQLDTFFIQQSSLKIKSQTVARLRKIHNNFVRSLQK